MAIRHISIWITPEYYMVAYYRGMNSSADSWLIIYL